MHAHHFFAVGQCQISIIQGLCGLKGRLRRGLDDLRGEEEAAPLSGASKERYARVMTGAMRVMKAMRLP